MRSSTSSTATRRRSSPPSARSERRVGSTRTTKRQEAPGAAGGLFVCEASLVERSPSEPGNLRREELLDRRRLLNEALLDGKRDCIAEHRLVVLHAVGEGILPE